MALLTILLLPVLALAVYLCTPAPNAPAQPRITRLATRPPTELAPAIPRIIWSYWHSAEQPEVVRRCIANWARHNPDYKIHVLSAATLSQHVPAADRPADFDRHSPARQSDWLRLYLLHRHGGIWLDASIILTRSLDWMLHAQQADSADYLGFYLQRYTTRPQCPVIDSWAMAAPAGSPFMADWFAEFSGRAWPLGDAQYLAELHTHDYAAEVLQRIASPDYMMIHVTAQRVLQRGGAYRLHLIRAEDSAYFYQHASRWRRGFFFANLLLRPAPKAPAALIKLRGGERRKLEPYLSSRCIHSKSIFGCC